ncbi:uncharacterized protein LOC110248496 [Exaiptasia diaphana]|uniref:Uncharacterized protein n=1 Tax=Exaiptasia diaphana TaxID=2652724 RepID=A0A913XUX7_EXADI|nr:uncharacterized protein LOC110248496 [Exaiptasia diaphana]
MPETENPRAFVRPKPLPLPSHRGLKITARNARIYTCEVPTRKQVAHDNYARRKHQMTKCGYRSVNYKPYQCVGEVVLNDKKLIMSALGQDHDQITEFQESDSSSSDYDSEGEITQAKTAMTRIQHQPTAASQATSYKPKQINDIRAQVSKGRKMINAVKLGFGLYRIVKDEQELKQAVAEEERRKKEEAAKNEMRPPSSDGENTDDEDIDAELKSMFVELSPGPTSNMEDDFKEQFLDVRESTAERPDSSSSTASSQRWKKINSALSAANPLGAPVVHVTDTSQEALDELDRSMTSNHFMTERRNIASAPSGHRSYLGCAKSSVSLSSRGSRRSRKQKNARPYSPLYSNINYNDSTDRASVYRQLCALLWILEAMSQDQQPAVMPPITSCWKLKLLNEDPRFIRKRAEKDKTTEKDWTLFKQDPNRFTQRATSRRGTRRISIHPNFLQRLSNTASTASPRPSIPTLKVPDGGAPRSNAAFDRNTEETVSHQIAEKSQDEAPPATFNEPVTRATGAPSETQYPSSPVNGSPTEKKTRFIRQKSFTVTTVYNTNASRAMHKLRAKNRAAKAFKSSLSQKELDKLSQDDQPSRSESRVSAWVQATGKRQIDHITISCGNVGELSGIELAIPTINIFIVEEFYIYYLFSSGTTTMASIFISCAL